MKKRWQGNTRTCKMYQNICSESYIHTSLLSTKGLIISISWDFPWWSWSTFPCKARAQKIFVVLHCFFHSLLSFFKDDTFILEYPKKSLTEDGQRLAKHIRNRGRPANSTVKKEKNSDNNIKTEGMYSFLPKYWGKHSQVTRNFVVDSVGWYLSKWIWKWIFRLIHLCVHLLGNSFWC